ACLEGPRRGVEEEVQMLKSWITPIAAALAVVLLAGTINPAEAYRRNGWKGYSGARIYAGPRLYAGNYYHRNHHRGLVGVPVVYGYGYYGYSGYGDCSWLRHRAAVTGSGYWWSRYRACVDGYY